MHICTYAYMYVYIYIHIYTYIYGRVRDDICEGGMVYLRVSILGLIPELWLDLASIWMLAQVSAKEPYVSSKEPNVSANKPYFRKRALSKELSKELSMPAKEPLHARTFLL